MLHANMEHNPCHAVSMGCAVSMRLVLGLLRYLKIFRVTIELNLILIGKRGILCMDRIHRLHEWCSIRIPVQVSKAIKVTPKS